MSETVIRVENLGKKYVIDQAGDKARYGTLRESLTNGVRGFARRLFGRKRAEGGPTKEEFWALKDVSFEVKRGEVVGVIGRNGAGKSTLLKLLSQITGPTTGRIELDGRVASLLEVGTGFHPELTGRENVFLNGAILGMNRAEIKRKFDEIVAFAEVEKFLDTPVKRYSSGMYMRLAFAVAAHLEPEILIVDEVLAVGDTTFQKKCMRKLSETGQNGSTVLFVSHNMAAVENLCERVMVVSQGRVVYTGAREAGIQLYLGDREQTRVAQADLIDHPNRRVGSTTLLKHIACFDVQLEPATWVCTGDELVIDVSVTEERESAEFDIGVMFSDNFGNRLFTVATSMSLSGTLKSGGKTRCRIEQIPLPPGAYWLSVNVKRRDANEEDWIDKVLSLDIECGNYYGNGRMADRAGGLFAVRSIWQHH